MRRGDKIRSEASYIPTELYLNELQEHLFITNQANSSFDVYLSTDDHDILKNIEKKRERHVVFILLFIKNPLLLFTTSSYTHTKEKLMAFLVLWFFNPKSNTDFGF